MGRRSVRMTALVHLTMSSYMEPAKPLNRYARLSDLQAFRAFCYQQGQRVWVRRGALFSPSHRHVEYLGYIERGGFRYMCVDRFDAGHVVGYAFEQEGVGDYQSFVTRSESAVDIEALSDATVWRVSCCQLRDWLDRDAEGERLARRLSEMLFVDVYDRMLDFYRLTPEQRYRQVMTDYPQLKELVPLREIASYIGVTPETVSHYRQRLLLEEKS